MKKIIKIKKNEKQGKKEISSFKKYWETYKEDIERQKKANGDAKDTKVYMPYEYKIDSDLTLPAGTEIISWQGGSRRGFQQTSVNCYNFLNMLTNLDNKESIDIVIGEISKHYHENIYLDMVDYILKPAYRKRPMKIDTYKKKPLGKWIKNIHKKLKKKEDWGYKDWEQREKLFNAYENNLPNEYKKKLDVIFKAGQELISMLHYFLIDIPKGYIDHHGKNYHRGESDKSGFAKKWDAIKGTHFPSAFKTYFKGFLKMIGKLPEKNMKVENMAEKVYRFIGERALILDPMMKTEHETTYENKNRDRYWLEKIYYDNLLDNPKIGSVKQQNAQIRDERKLRCEMCNDAELWRLLGEYDERPVDEEHEYPDGILEGRIMKSINDEVELKPIDTIIMLTLRKAEKQVAKIEEEHKAKIEEKQVAKIEEEHKAKIEEKHKDKIEEEHKAKKDKKRKELKKQLLPATSSAKGTENNTSNTSTKKNNIMKLNLKF